MVIFISFYILWVHAEIFTDEKGICNSSSLFKKFITSGKNWGVGRHKEET